MSRKRLWSLAVASSLAIGVSHGAVAQNLRPTPIIKAVPAIPQQIDSQAKYEGEASAFIAAEQASTLVQFDAQNIAGGGCGATPHVQNDIRGNLAVSWEYNADRTELLFKIREGVKSATGNELSAQDVKWSLDRATELAGIVRFLMNKVSAIQEKDAVEVVDSHTVKIKLQSPRIFDFVIFTWSQMQIHDSKTVKDHATADDPLAKAWMANNNADFGPWQITDENFEPGNRVTMIPNPNYWNKKARGNANRLVVLGVADPSTRSQLLRSGEIDFAGALPLQEYANLQNEPNIDVVNCVGGVRDTLLLNYQDERFANPKVRQAISYAIDRDAIVKGVFQGFGKPAVTGIHTDYGIDGLVRYITHDVARAKQLMAEAGYADGFSAKFVVSQSRPGAHAEQEAIFIKDMLKQIGVDLTIEVAASGTAFSEQFFKGNYEAMLYSESPAFGDPFYSLNLMNHGNSFQNSFKYANGRYDELVSEGLTLPGDALDRRKAILVELAEIMSTNPPQVYLVDRGNPVARNKAITNWENQGGLAGNITAYLLRKPN